MKIRAHLTLIAIATLIPVVVFSAIAVNKLLDAERRSALKNLQETARLTALIVDRELQSAQAALLVLGTSKSLAERDMRAFYAEAEAADRGAGAWTVLSDESGRQLINTVVPFGTTLPDVSHQVQEVLSKQTTVVSNVFKSPAAGSFVTTVSIPVPLDNGRHYVLSETFAASYFTRAFAQSRIPASWTVAILDGNGNFIARSQQSETMPGKPARPELIKAASEKLEGQIRHLTWEGVDSYDVFTHAGFSGWTIAVAAPAYVVEDAARQAVLFSTLGLLVAILGAAGTAALVSHRLVLSIENAGKSAAALGRGEQLEANPTGVEEMDKLNAVLVAVGNVLMREKASLQHAEAERERLLLNEQIARKNAEDQNAAKDQFLAMLGHELRNPLSAISGAISLTRVKSATPELIARAHAIIERQSGHLSHIVDDLLDLSRLSLGKISLNIARVDLSALARACADALPVNEHSAPVRLHIDERSVWINADRTRLEQIIANLLGNALKFTPASGIIDVSVRSEGRFAILIIRDSGIGISRELMPFIFDAFVQGAGQSGKSVGGLGIGLNLVRQLVELHGGSVHVVSDGNGKGTTVSAHFPLAGNDEVIGTPQQTVRKNAIVDGTVLLIEDNEDSREMMSSILRLNAIRVIEAATGEEGIRIAQREQPDVAIVDIGLPDIDGYLIAQRLRAGAATAAIKLVAFTGYGQEADRKRAIQAGFDAHLVKPVDTVVLLSMIAELIGGEQPDNTST